MIGEKYGRLLIQNIDPQNKNNCICLCDCGTIKSINARNIKKGYTRSCGCLHKEIISNKLTKDLSGQKFGRLTAIRIDAERHTKYTYWICKCDCGKEVSVRSSCLVNGNTKSCGCLKSELTSARLSLNLEGERFGKLKVLRRDGTFVGNNGTMYSQWKCICDCGTYKTVRGHDLIRGSVTSCGCIISVGEYEVRKSLNREGIEFKTQYTFPDLKSDKGWCLKFDFGLLKDGLLIGLIEYQGIQHFVEQPFGFGKMQRESTDDMKRKYCKKNGIRLFEITYKDDIEESIKAIKEELLI